MRIVRTTDGQHLGVEVHVLNIGDTANLAGFEFQVLHVSALENGNLLFSNPNYQLECEES